MDVSYWKKKKRFTTARICHWPRHGSHACAVDLPEVNLCWQTGRAGGRAFPRWHQCHHQEELHLRGRLRQTLPWKWYFWTLTPSQSRDRERKTLTPKVWWHSLTFQIWWVLLQHRRDGCFKKRVEIWRGIIESLIIPMDCRKAESIILSHRFCVWI